MNQAVRAVDQERTVLSCMDTHLEVVDIHKAEEGKGMDKEDSLLLLMEVRESVVKMPLMWKIWRMAFLLFPMVQMVGLEDRDMLACRTGRAYKMGMDKNTEDIHKNRKNQGVQKQLILRL
jgi:hypothetical protein